MNENEYVLNAPEEYLKLSDKEKNRIVNQCGPDGIVNKLVPNSILGLSIVEECNLHDYMYFKATDKVQAKKADDLFLENLNKKIDAQTKSKVLKVVRKFMSGLYYRAVRIYSFFTK
ncbi:MAG: hypothetical protein HRT44_02725 [Bdellovibrionales bacterium]|nr:DUF1353 domain-containing protein [Bdellovibrionales bacterium]NQZ18161.1 hypothetical protein [Bdellovibrionales bacterium]